VKLLNYPPSMENHFSLKYSRYLSILTMFAHYR